MKKITLSLAIMFSMTLSKELLSLEKALPTVYATVWAGSATLETLSLLSNNIRHAIYGNNSVSEQTTQTLKNILSSVNMSTPTDIKQSHSLWAATAGNIFSNHNSLFVSTEILSHIQSGAPLSDQTKRELVTAALMIQNNFDKKILAAYIAIPLAIWTTIYYLDALLQKLTTSDPEHDLIQKSASVIKFLKKSWHTKALVSLSVVGAFIFYQRYSITTQAVLLLSQ